MWVDDLDAAEKKVMDAGGTYLAGARPRRIPSTRRNSADPNGIVFDLTHNGWVGAAKDVVPKA